ncbi:Lsr2 family DNA-binding protein [Phytohabitans aurantiacus]|uniref:Lsr2 DNA-binding domain-containing protein n=1 Tax=Phytohabitans aurantiacus TaxID=3016789 RepID=A0ABQ5QK19_9ACTN|nr:histone-like nucleoid-structuring protein Lsr2 [Phytohabitans aurantiacus]GLH94898.1 hypothetical protein Pa4123_01700 [Phytohabitans aurantiacus]
MQPEIMIAAKPGIVYLEGQRRMVRKGRTTAHSTHPIVTEHPRLWERLKVDYPAGLTGPAGDAYDAAVAAAGVPVYEALRALAEGLADRGHDVQVAAGDEASVPMAVVLAALAVIDERTATEDDAAQPPAAYGMDLHTADPGPIEARTLDGGVTVVNQPEDTAADLASEAALVDARRLADEYLTDSAEFRAAVRAWAATQEIEVSPRGKIPATVIEQYRAAHGGD